VHPLKERKYNPHIFGLKRHVGSSSITFGNRKWIIVDHTTRETVYVNSPEHPEKYLYRPPGVGWKAVKDDDKSNVVVNHCTGSLENSPPLNVGEASNIGQLLQRPVTTILLGIIFAIAYYLWVYYLGALETVFGSHLFSHLPRAHCTVFSKL